MYHSAFVARTVVPYDRVLLVCWFKHSSRIECGTANTYGAALAASGKTQTKSRIQRASLKPETSAAAAVHLTVPAFLGVCPI